MRVIQELTPKPRKPIVIEFTPEEQDYLFAMAESVFTIGKANHATAAPLSLLLSDALRAHGATPLRAEGVVKIHLSGGRA